MGTLAGIEGMGVLVIIVLAFLIGDWTWPNSRVHFHADDFIAALPLAFVLGIVSAIIFGIVLPDLISLSIAVVAFIPLGAGFHLKRDEHPLDGIVHHEQNIGHWGDEWLWNISLGMTGHEGWEVEPGSISLHSEGATAIIHHGQTRVAVVASRWGYERIGGKSWIRVRYGTQFLEGDDRLFNALRKRIALKGIF
jgi:hypothetical protein